MGYSFIALMTDYLSEQFYSELYAHGVDLTKPDEVIKVKSKIFADLTPIIQQEEVAYSVFEDISQTPAWKNLVRLMGHLVKNSLDAIERHAKHSKHTWDVAKGKMKL